ncbi:MAG: sugar phosphate isomerase/epimerase [Lachnospiraceae bacterium]|nr:sugar phosphate isomerase/epimerase [Lachnospiraceae bacterium]
MALKVAAALYSVRDEMAKDPFAAVKSVSDLGYKFYETCNNDVETDNGCGFGISAEELKDILDGYGARVISAHLYPFGKADLKEVIRYNQVLGNTNLVDPAENYGTYDDIMQACERMNSWGRILADEGMHFVYHTHQRENMICNGSMVLDLMADNTDPDLVSFEIDTFWMLRGGTNPAEILRHFGKRVRLIHQKDFAWDALQAINIVGITEEERQIRGVGFPYDPVDPEEQKKGLTCFAEVGTGLMDIQSIIDAANEYTAAEYIILEQDHTRMSSQIDSLAVSKKGFGKFTGIEWA